MLHHDSMHFGVEFRGSKNHKKCEQNKIYLKLSTLRETTWIWLMNYERQIIEMLCYLKGNMQYAMDWCGTLKVFFVASDYENARILYDTDIMYSIFAWGHLYLTLNLEAANI